MNTIQKPIFNNASGEFQEHKLPCNMTFSCAEQEFGILVSVYGLTAGPPAMVDSPQILVPDYNPAACFKGPSLGGDYYAYMIAFLDTQTAPIIKVHGWVTNVNHCQGKFNLVSLEIPIQATLVNP